MFEIGRLCIKVVGRDAGKKCIIVDIVDKNTVVVDGETRRKKCNIKHIDPFNKVLKIKKNATHQEVVDVLKKEGIESRVTKPKKASAKPKKQNHGVKSAVASEEKGTKKEKEAKKTKQKKGK